MNPVILLLVGLGTYVLLWRDPSAAPYPSGAGLWRSAPAWLRHLVRRGDGPLVISALAVQAAALVTLIVGVIAWSGGSARDLGGTGLVVVTIAWVVALVVWGLLALRARFDWWR